MRTGSRYTSDNGAQPGQGGTNAPLRGWKTQLYEGGVKVPGFVHSPLLPAVARGTIHHGLFHVADWLPTIVTEKPFSFSKPADSFAVIRLRS
jgi:arylsulfatase A-like enzyme